MSRRRPGHPCYHPLRLTSTPPTVAFGRRLTDSGALQAAAAAVVVVAGGWWMLGQLAAVLRPLLLAVFLAYVLMPYYGRLRKYLPTPVAIGLLAGATTAVLVGVALSVLSGLNGLAVEEPQLKAKVLEWFRWGSERVHQVPAERPRQRRRHRAAGRIGRRPADLHRTPAGERGRVRRS